MTHLKIPLETYFIMIYQNFVTLLSHLKIASNVVLFLENYIAFDPERLRFNLVGWRVGCISTND